MAAMDILFVVPYVPNLIRVRPYNLIRYLGLRGHRVTVATLWTNESEYAAVEDLRALCHRVVALPISRWRSLFNAAATLPGSSPLQANYSWLPALAQAMEKLVWPEAQGGKAAFDVAHVEHLRGARYGEYLQACFRRNGNTPLPIIWDSVDSITHLFRQSSKNSKKITSRLLTQFELGRTEKHEAALVGKFDRVLVTSKNDREAFLSLRGLRQPVPAIEVLANGVDLNYFAPDESVQRDPRTVVISGKMSYHANVSMVLNFAAGILPRIRAGYPDVKLVVVGKDPPREVKALAADPNIIVTGTVADIRPYLREAAVAAAPLTYGAGIQNKVLEAMACGTPVVTTTKAVSALDIQAEKELLVADGDEAFARQVCRLLESPQLRRAVGSAGRQYVERNHRWPAIAAQLEDIYTEAIACRGAASSKSGPAPQNLS